MPTAQTTVNLAHVQTDAGDANHGRTPLAVQPLTQGLWRRDLAGAPIPHCRRGLDDRTDPGPLGAPATRLRSALRRGQAALRHSSGKGGNLLGKKGLDRWSAIRQLQSVVQNMGKF